MKKFLFTLFIFLVNCVLFAQVPATNSISEAINLLGNPVPSGFVQVERTFFSRITHEGLTIGTSVQNGIVTHVSVGGAFSTTHEASGQRGVFFRELENRGTFIWSSGDGDFYRIGNVIAWIEPISRRLDGLITVGVNFIMDDL